MDRDRLQAALEREFDADPATCRVVTRQAVDLADSGKLERDIDVAVAVETVLSNLADAPAEYGLRDRWNWWLGALSLSHGGYERFTVRPRGDR
jgi:hypothetical protein